MELEVRDVPQRNRSKYQNRLKSYKTELSKLDKDLVSSICLKLIELFLILQKQTPKNTLDVNVCSEQYRKYINY